MKTLNISRGLQFTTKSNCAINRNCSEPSGLISPPLHLYRSKKRALCFLLRDIANLCYGETLIESFSGTKIDSAYWKFETSNATATVSNGLIIEIPAHPVSGWYAGIRSKFPLIGEFDVQVDCCLNSWKNYQNYGVAVGFTNDASGMTVCRVSSYDYLLGIDPKERYYASASGEYYQSETTDVQGKLRFVRKNGSGDDWGIFTAYYWDTVSNVWQPIMSQNHQSGDDTLFVGVWDLGGDNDSGLQIVFSNLVVMRQTPSSDTSRQSYLAGVGVGENSLRYLKVARISDTGGSPSVTQVERDISDDFTSVQDVAFLRSINHDRLIAVLGNCVDFVPSEFYEWYRNHGYNHHLQGKVVIYVVTDSGDISIAGTYRTITFDHTITTTDATVSYSDRGGQHGETWRIAGLSGGGFAVNVSDVRDPGAGWQPDRDNPYNWLLLFDPSYSLRFSQSVWSGWSDGNMIDVAGINIPGTEAVACSWRGVAGGGNGVLRRYRIDWNQSTVVEEANLVGASGWIYYYHNIVPLAYLGTSNTIDGGIVARDNGMAGNIAGNFTSGYLDSSKNWGKISVSGGLEVIGLNTDGTNLFMAFRCSGDTNYLYRINATNGTYTEINFAFAWEGTPWTVTASDGDAIAYSIIAPHISSLHIAPISHLHLPSVVGQKYQVETSPKIPIKPWLPFGEVISGTGNDIEMEIPTTNDFSGFFRVNTTRE